MNIIEFAIKLQKKIIKRGQPMFNTELDEQYKVLNKFNNPSDYIERSYYQYLCQMKQTSIIFRLIQNISAILLSPVYFINYCLKRTPKNNKTGNTAIFIPGTEEGYSLIPNSLKNEFNEIILSGYNNIGIIKKPEKEMIFRIIKKYWHKPYFCLKSMMKIAIYAYQIELNKANAVITRGEFSFTSSLLTLYCNKIGVEHINIMHGERLFDIKNSFSHFDRFYVWDEHYMNLMIKLRCYKEQFIIALPDSIILNMKSGIEYKYDMTYYLGAESTKELEEIVSSLRKSKFSQNKICIRYHPTYCYPDEVRKIFKDYYIQNPNEVPLVESLSITKHVISLYSTVLFQAYKNGKSVVIDNVSNKTKFDKLKMLDYIMINKPHLLLSDFIKK